MSVDDLNITFIGMGEAGAAFVAGWQRSGQVSAYDIKLDSPETRQVILDRCAGLNIRCCPTPAAALADADLVFSAVTADQAVAAARVGAAFVKGGAIWCDLNSCAPSSKLEASGYISKAGGRYVDVAVMSPVQDRQNLTPVLISGKNAGKIAPLLTALPMSLRVVGAEIGRASSIKMIRSIMVKGLEALTAECTLAAVAAGVEDEVIGSLKSGHPHIDVAQWASYNFERSIVHGERRGAEMLEVAKTLADLGLPGRMSAASADWQFRIGRSDLLQPASSQTLDYRDLATALLSRLRTPQDD